MANADVPFARIVDAVDAPRSASYTPLFQNMLSLQTEGPDDAAAGSDLGNMTGLRTEPMPVRPPPWLIAPRDWHLWWGDTTQSVCPPAVSGCQACGAGRADLLLLTNLRRGGRQCPCTTASLEPALTRVSQAVERAGLWRGQAEASAAQMDLVLELLETPDEVAGSLEYATDLFTRSTMDRMAGHLQVGSLRHAVCGCTFICMPQRALGNTARLMRCLAPHCACEQAVADQRRKGNPLPRGFSHLGAQTR